MALPRINLSPPDIGALESKFVLRALKSGWVAPAGPDLRAFESEVAVFCERQYAVAVSSGTAALHLALIALDVQPNDIVICSTMTFVATANAIAYTGASPVLVDSEIQSGNMSPELLETAIANAHASGRRVGAVIPVDFLGKVADYASIEAICRKHGIPVVADSAESLGSLRNDRPAGSFGEVAILSFNGNKIATTSGGGAVLTDSKRLAEKVRFLANQAREATIHYEHSELGFNYRLSNILAALGRAQLERLPKMIEQRKINRSRYRNLFYSVEGVEVFGADDREDNCWLTAIEVGSKMDWSARDLAAFLNTRNIETRPLWKPMHLQPLYAGCESVLDGSSDTLFERGLAMPSGSNLTEHEWDRIALAITGFISSRV